MEELKIETIIFYVRLKPTGSLQLAVLADGRFCILKNERPMDQYFWPKEEMAEAVKTFQKVKRQLLIDEKSANNW